MANQSIKAAFERFWHHVIVKLSDYATKEYVGTKITEYDEATTNVSYGEAQSLTDEQKAQARENIGAPSIDNVPNVPDWALAETKPTYTADEVGALPSSTVVPSLDGYATEEYVSEQIAATAELPTVTTDDNGAFLRVVDGAWAVTTIANAEEATF